jgi:glutamate racemase
MPTPSASAPIGVFDSGVGGLSVLRALRERLPHERFLYVADSGHAPYGEKTAGEISERSRRITQFLRQDMGCKALVIACNTATAVAAPALRQDHTGWPIIGIEPAIKPAAQHTRTGTVGVLATLGTLRSDKYQALRQRVMAAHQDTEGSPLLLREVACKGLAQAIEQLSHAPADAAGHGDIHTQTTQAEARVQALVDTYLHALGPIGQGSGQVDTIVLGCTHYPLVDASFRQRLPAHVRLWDPGDRVAQRTADVLSALGLQASATSAAEPQPESDGNASANPRPRLQLWTSGEPAHLTSAARHWLGLSSPNLPTHPSMDPNMAQALPC